MEAFEAEKDAEIDFMMRAIAGGVTMPDRNEVHTPNCGVTFTKSSNLKDGGAGYTIYVNEGADEDEAVRVFKLAARLRDDAEFAIRGSNDA